MCAEQVVRCAEDTPQRAVARRKGYGQPTVAHLGRLGERRQRGGVTGDRLLDNRRQTGFDDGAHDVGAVARSPQRYHQIERRVAQERGDGVMHRGFGQRLMRRHR